MRQKLRLIILMLCGSLLITSSIYSQEIKPIQISINQKTYPLYPETLEELPDIPSPYTTEDGMEIVIAFTKDNKSTLIPVTVENGEPMNYNEGQWGKGNQLKIDAEDFPTLAKTGLHSETELEQTRTITGKSIAEITEIGRPKQSSIAGFMSYDEDIISVLKGDNRLVEKMDLTHPQLAKPLFNVFNLILQNLKYYQGKIRPPLEIDYILHNGRKIYLEYGGSKGWQNSIFNDEVLGYWKITMRRELNEDEKTFINKEYSILNEEQMADLIKMLSHIHTGEMVPYYVMRYGFYEGHTDYRADPITIAFIFGLKSIEEIESVFNGNLYEALTTHFNSK